jgi:Family of unknown function (DUF5317)
VFVLYAIPIGIALGFLMGGRLDRLGELRFEWGWLAIAGLAVQVVLFSGLVGGAVGRGVGEAIYVASTGAVLVAVWRNLSVPGLPLVAIGAISNLIAIVANEGIMPTTHAALAAAGLSAEDGFSNSAVVADPAVAPLTDIFAMPPWLPFANVFSVGDVLIGLGIVLVIALGMRGGGAQTA